MAVLDVLMQNAGEVVSRDAFVNEVWQGRVTVDEALTRCISELRKIFNDSNKQPEYIQTVHKKGYKLLVVPQTLDNESHAVDSAARRSLNQLQLTSFVLILLTGLFFVGWKMLHLDQQAEPFQVAEENTYTDLNTVRSLLFEAEDAAHTLYWRNTNDNKRYQIKSLQVLEEHNSKPQALVKIVDDSDFAIWQTRYANTEVVMRHAAIEAAIEVLMLLKTQKRAPELAGLQRSLHASYQHALFLIDSRGQDNLALAVELLDDILAKQPDFIMALVQKSVAVRMQSFYQPSIELREQKTIQYNLLIKQARLLDASHPVIASLASQIDTGIWNWREYETRLTQAVEYAPACTICVRNLAEHYLNLGHYQRAETLVTQHLEFFPLSIMMHSFLGQICNMQGKTECASSQVQTIAALGRSSGSDTLAMELNIAIINGDAERYRVLSTAMVEKHPGYSAHKAAMDALLANDYEAFIDHVDSMPRLDFNMAVSAGRFTQLVERIIRNISNGNVRDLRLLHGWLAPDTHLSTYYRSRLKALKNRPDIQQFLTDIRLLDFWRETDRWPDYCVNSEYQQHRPSFC